MRHTKILLLACFQMAVVVTYPSAASAQTMTDNLPADTASGIAVRSANNGYGPTDNSPKAMAEKQRVNTLVEQYQNCRASARQLATNKAGKDNIRAQCVRTYQPKFSNACVGGANSIAICIKLRRQGKID
jgi:hypothetical protein